jgi:hypothetical protein
MPVDVARGLLVGPNGTTIYDYRSGCGCAHGARTVQRDDERLVRERFGIALCIPRSEGRFFCLRRVRAILRWGNLAAEELAERENSIRRLGVSSAVLHVTDRQLAALIERGRGWPWNGYELRLMKAAGRYPPKRFDGA